MAKQESRKSGGAKTSRTETVTVRLDPKLRYLAEIAGRVQRRTLSSYIEWAVEESLKNVELYRHKDAPVSVFDAGNGPGQKPLLWDPIEADRFTLLAEFFPTLLTHDEQKLWKLIKEVWNVINPPAKGAPDTFMTTLKELEFVREHWEFLRNSANEDLPASEAIKRIKEVEGG